MIVLAMVSLAVLAIVCACGVFSQRYRENWAQFFGMVGMCMYSVARCAQLASGYGYVDLSEVGIYLAMSLYAFGTAWKVVAYAREERQPLHVQSLSARELREVRGGSKPWSTN